MTCHDEADHNSTEFERNLELHRQVASRTTSAPKNWRHPVNTLPYQPGDV